MTRVILITFGFLGWAWYEMSGGGEFEAGSQGVTLLATFEPETVETENLDDAPVEDVVVTRADTTSEPLTTVSAAPKPRIKIIDPSPTSVDGQKLEDVAALAANLDSADSSDTIVLGGLSGSLTDLGRPVGLRDTDVQPVVASAAVDYRVVTGNRVNLRGGPSTSYGVVTRLLRGNEVEILQDDGTGWVKLRALDGNEIGWMSADFLVAAN